MRYYLDWSMIFDNPDNEYDVELFKRTIKEAGGVDVRTACKYGWSNQPAVVTFSVKYKSQLDIIEYALDKLLVFINTFGCVIRRKDW